MAANCAVYCCKNRYAPETDVDFFTFPDDNEALAIWLNHLRLKKLDLNRHSRICSEHFTKRDFKTHNNVRILKPHVIPSIFPHLQTLKKFRKAQKRKLHFDSEDEPPEKKLADYEMEGDDRPQESEKDSTDKNNYCRLCTHVGGQTVPIFSNERDFHFAEILENRLSIKVSREDQLPLRLCIYCAGILEAFDGLAKSALESENALKKLFLEGPPKIVTEMVEEPITFSDSDEGNLLDMLVPKVPNAQSEIAERPKAIRSPDADIAYSAIPAAWLDVLSCNKCNAIGVNPISTIGSSLPLKCPRCGIEVIGSENLINHFKKHGEVKKKLPRDYLCQICGRDFAILSKAENHEKICGQKMLKLKCDICSESFLTEKELDKHIAAHNLSCICHLCGMLFNRPIFLERHLERVHKEVEHVCHICGDSFKDKETMTEHVHHHTGQMDFTCHLCGKASANAQLFSDHLATHAPQLPFSCPFCCEKFKDSLNLRNHQLSIHGVSQKIQEPPKGYVCDVCGLSFKRPYTLNIHKQNIHEGKKTYVCNICGKGFNRTSVLNTHRRIMHALSKSKYKCGQCEKVLGSKALLQRHLAKHEEEKRFKCKFCDKEYAFLGSLDMHIRKVHKKSTLKKLACDMCGVVCNFASELQRHMTSHSL